MRFLDKTLFALGADASMNIDSYDESDSAETSFATSILRGAFRFVSGLLVKEKPKKVRVICFFCGQLRCICTDLKKKIAQHLQL